MYRKLCVMVVFVWCVVGPLSYNTQHAQQHPKSTINSNIKPVSQPHTHTLTHTQSRGPEPAKPVCSGSNTYQMICVYEIRSVSVLGSFISTNKVQFSIHVKCLINEYLCVHIYLDGLSLLHSLSLAAWVALSIVVVGAFVYLFGYVYDCIVQFELAV